MKIVNQNDRLQPPPERDTVLRLLPLLLIGLLMVTGAPRPAQADSAADIAAMSLDSLLDIPVVTASKYGQQASSAPASITVITSEDIRRHGWTTLDEVLESVHGFYVTNDHQYENLGVRGFSPPGDFNTKVAVMMNGHQLQESVYHQSAMGTGFVLNFSEVDRIEIIRGPGSALYGTGAALAVINVILKTPEARQGVEMQVDGGLNAYRAGSVGMATHFGQTAVLSISAQAANSNGSRLYLPSYDTPEWGDGEIQGQNWLDSYSYVSQFRLRSVKLLTYAMSRVKGNGAAAWGTSYGSQQAYLRDSYYGAEMSSQRLLSSHIELYGRASFDLYDYAALFPYDEPDPDSREHAQDQRLGTELRADWTPSSAQRILLGAEGNFRPKVMAENRYEDGSSANQIDDPFNDFSVFAQSEYTVVPAVTATAGGRYSVYSRGDHTLVPRGALLWKPFAVSSFKLLYGEAFRIPSTYETSWKEPNFWISNPGLRPENIQTVEAIYEQRLGENWATTTSAFHFAISDLIEGYSASDEDLPSYRNVSSAHANGIEAEIAYRKFRGMHGNVSYSYQVTRDEKRDAILTNSPQHLVKLGLSDRVTKYAYLGLEYRFESARKTLADTFTDPVHLVHLSLSTSERLDPWRVSLRVKNLFNQKWSVPGGEEFMLPGNNVDMPEIPQDARMISLSISYRTRF